VNRTVENSLASLASIRTVLDLLHGTGLPPDRIRVDSFGVG
jgi:hypothetical protein